ncbi:DUF3887 domain-containing protein [Sporosarcina sp. PTS2304]|uniref:DUF3887 domain-containing protein n=1 Tax=Sporosarcina sp. PTS2304 TaxID=2283194 RepID=UPI0013B39CC8|nr:DUF3887 domain-containing protein [Sporosarcina sp. PTS2304]
MKKIVLFAVVSAFLLSACGSNKIDDTTAKLYSDKAERIVSLLHEENFDEMRTMFDEAMKEAMPVEQLQVIADIVKESGEFVRFENSSSSLREGYYIINLVTAYSKYRRVYTLTFDDQQRMAAFHVK